MIIDWSPLTSVNDIFIDLLKVLGIPLILTVIIVGLLTLIKVPKKIVSVVMPAVFLIAVYYMFVL